MPSDAEDGIQVPILAQVVVKVYRPPLAYFLGVLLVASFGIVSATLLWFTWPPRMGLEVAGGTRLVYAIADRPPDSRADGIAPIAHSTMDALIRAVHRRVNPSNTQEMIVRRYGEDRVEIIVPSSDPPSIEKFKGIISTTGALQFRVVANSRDHQDVIDLAVKAAQDPETKQRRIVLDKDGQKVGLWARVGREKHARENSRPLMVDVSFDTVRDAESGQILKVPDDLFKGSEDDFENDVARRLALTRFVADQGIQQLDVLLATNDGLDVGGSHLASVQRSLNELLEPNILFRLTQEGIPLFAELTGQNAPHDEFTRRLGIVFDDELLTAPTIQERIVEFGQINGRFTADEVQVLVSILGAGALPVPLVKQPVVEELYVPDPSATQRIQTVSIFGCGILLFSLLSLVVRFGRYGFAAILACTVQCLMSLTLIALIGTAISQLLITTLFAVAFNFVLCNSMVCKTDRNERRSENRELESSRISFLSVVIYSTLLFFVATGLAVVVYQLGGFGWRALALAVICSCCSALIAFLSMWGPPAVTTVFGG
jgi:SecD/SecF fusion protein